MEWHGLAEKGSEDRPLPQKGNCLLPVKLGAETCFPGYRGLDVQ